MANVNIDGLPVAGTITGAELLEMEQVGVNSQVTAATLLATSAAIRGGTFSSYIPPSGDTTGVIDTAAFVAADVLSGQGFRNVTGESDPFAFSHTLLGSGTYYINAPQAFMNPANKVAKVRGRIFEGNGSNLTSIVYTGSGGVPLCQNQMYQNVQMYGMTIICAGLPTDFYWGQEQAGLSNIQYNRFEDFSLEGVWSNSFRLTGGNNNSEWQFNRCFGGSGNFIFVPPPITATITSGTAAIAVPNSPPVVVLGDTCSFNTTSGNITAGTQYYVIASSATSIQISTTRGGAALVPTSTFSATVAVGSDQFLNFWFHQFKFDPGSRNASILNMSFGGSFSFVDTDISGWSPTVDTYLFQLLNVPSSTGVTSFRASKMRVEHSSDHALLIKSNWPFGTISFDQLDQGSQVGNRLPTNQYSNYNWTNNPGTVVEYSNSTLIGTCGITTGVNNYNMQSSMLLTNCQLLQNSTATFINWVNGGNSGGAPRVRFRNCPTWGNAAITGFQEGLDTDLFWNLTIGGMTNEKVISIVGANSDFPAGGGSTPPVRLPLNAAITKVWFWKNAGGAGGAFQYTLQTLEGVPTVLAGGAGTSMAGANGALAIGGSTFTPVSAIGAPIVLTTDLMRTIHVVDTLAGGRVGAFSGGIFCLVFYIG